MKRLRARGIFLYEGADKFYARGVSYGPFQPNPVGEPLPEKRIVEADFARLARLGANAVRVYHVPPEWFVDLARSFGLRLLVGAPWSQHVRFLDSDRERSRARVRVRELAERYRGEPALLAHLVGNEISPEIVRWYGRERIQGFLAELADEVRQADPEALVSYANFPMTEYLELGFLDLLCFNVYLHRDEQLRRYVRRLQNLAFPRPLVITEFGVDSLREGEEEQSRILSRTCATLGEVGVSGSFVFSYTDEWFTGGCEIEDWAFGLVDRERNPKPACDAVARVYQGPLPTSPEPSPRVSVVICAYNAERTMRECLESLRHIRYPDFEVIVVDDGSTDATREIAEEFPEFRLISHENRGLSAARNEGIEAATGEIVAYTDSDCAVDPEWLTHLVRGLVESDAAGVGGPNLPPEEDSWVPNLVAHLPGGPTHVLFDDHVAEHVPGCNMAFWRERLVEIGGFDPVFRTAGDDVDLCWRLQDAGYTIAYAPAALVWHRRRHTFGAYLKQQRGYGHAEAQLRAKHTDRCEARSGARWHGQIYDANRVAERSRGGVVYGGIFGTGFFQTLYSREASLWQLLPRTLEWNVLAWGLLALGGLSLVVGEARPSILALGAAFSLWGPVHALVAAWRLPPIPGAPPVRGRLLAAGLTFLAPLVRARHRRGRLVRPVVGARAPFDVSERAPARASLRLSFWTETGADRVQCLDLLVDELRGLGELVRIDDGWQRADACLVGERFARADLRLLVQNHGGERRQIDVALCPRRKTLVTILQIAGALIATGLLATGAPLSSLAPAGAAIACEVAYRRAAARLRRSFLTAARALEGQCDLGPELET